MIPLGEYGLELRSFDSMFKILMVPFSQSLPTEEWDGFCVCSEDKASNYQASVLYYI